MMTMFKTTNEIKEEKDNNTKDQNEGNNNKSKFNVFLISTEY